MRANKVLQKLIKRVQLILGFEREILKDQSLTEYRSSQHPVPYIWMKRFIASLKFHAKLCFIILAKPFCESVLETDVESSMLVNISVNLNIVLDQTALMVHSLRLCFL